MGEHDVSSQAPVEVFGGNLAVFERAQSPVVDSEVGVIGELLVHQGMGRHRLSKLDWTPARGNRLDYEVRVVRRVSDVASRS